MSDAPERIWVEPDYDHGWAYPRGEWSITCPWPHADAVEYVRADRIAELEAELRETREVLKDIVNIDTHAMLDFPSGEPTGETYLGIPGSMARAFLAATDSLPLPPEGETP